MSVILDYRDTGLFNYLSKLGTYKVEALRKEQLLLREERCISTEQTQDITISNYKVFIQTAENSRSIFKELMHAEEKVMAVIQKLPKLRDKCEMFLQKSGEINEARRLNSTTLKKNAQLLEILEIPQLIGRCISECRYEESLQLANYVQMIKQNQGRIPAISLVADSVDNLWRTMLLQLVEQLRTDLRLPECLQIVSCLRRMQAFASRELKLKFLQVRDAWLIASLDKVPRDDAQQHLTKTIEVTRVNLFNIITQYRAIFSEETELETESINKLFVCDNHYLFLSWLQRKINIFLKTFEDDVQTGITSFDTVMGQCMYFGLSLSRIGVDFRGLMMPTFIKVIEKKFQKSITSVYVLFERALGKFILLNNCSRYTQNIQPFAAVEQTEEKTVLPPDSLLNFTPLAVLCNGYLSAFNEFRLCAPLTLAKNITQCLQRSLEMVATKVMLFYSLENPRFTEREHATFLKFCSCFIFDFIPYMQRCISAIFEKQKLSNQLGINLLTFEHEGLTHLQYTLIIDSLGHMLLNKLDYCRVLDTLKSNLAAGELA